MCHFRNCLNHFISCTFTLRFEHRKSTNIHIDTSVIALLQRYPNSYCSNILIDSSKMVSKTQIVYSRCRQVDYLPFSLNIITQNLRKFISNLPTSVDIIIVGNIYWICIQHLHENYIKLDTWIMVQRKSHIPHNKYRVHSHATLPRTTTNVWHIPGGLAWMAWQPLLRPLCGVRLAWESCHSYETGNQCCLADMKEWLLADAIGNR